MNRTIKIFRYIAELDAFDVTDEYREIADMLGLNEWNPVVWIGRLFVLDNDYGEHWFDNWNERESKSAAAEKLGLDANDLYFINPDRFQDGRDGPCHTPEFRKRFWTDVLSSLELSLDLLFDEARKFNEQTKKLIEEYGAPLEEEFITDLEERISAIQRKLATMD